MKPKRSAQAARVPEELAARDRRRLGMICAFLAAAVLFVYGRALLGDFVAWDDDINVTQNPYLNPATFQSLVAFWKAPFLKLYIPLTYSVWTAAAWFSRCRSGPLSPLSPGLFHSLNLCCQVASSLFAFGLFRVLLRAAKPENDAATSDWAAALGAAAFVFHPLHVEPVAWVSGLRDMISGAATVAALWLYAVSALASDARRRRLYFISATSLFAAALLSKPSAVVIPILAGLLDFGVLRRPLSRVLKSLSLWFVLAAGFALLTRQSQDALHIRALMPLWSRPLVALDSLAFYLFKLFWPATLSPDYGRAPDMALAKGWLYWTWTGPAALSIAIGLSRERRINAVCAGLFAVAPLPVLGLVPFIHQDLSTVADRYVYASILGPALAVAWYAGKWPSRRWPWAVAALIVVALGARSWFQVQVWSNTGTLFGHIVAHNPDSGIAHMNLANYLADHGDPQGAETHYREALRYRPAEGMPLNNLANFLVRQNRAAEAVPYYEKALLDGIAENVASAHNALGVILPGMGRPPQVAAAHFEAALKINPRNDRVQGNYASFLVQHGHPEDAIMHYQWALQLRPDQPEMRKSLAVALASIGKIKEAREAMAAGLGPNAAVWEVDGALGDYLQVHGQYAQALPFYEEVVKKSPGLPGARNSLGFTLAKLGRREEALRQYREAVRLDPRLTIAQFNLGSTLIEMGNTNAAIEVFSKALIAIPDNYELHHNFGIVLLRAGHKEEAVRHFQEALRLRPNFEPSQRILAQLPH